MYMPPVSPRRLVARRRSRCFQCDKPMLKQKGLWWCKTCNHVVTYTQLPRLK